MSYKTKVVETTAMGETWWNVVYADAPDDFDERYVLGSFSKSKSHADIFAALLNISTNECRNKDNV